MMSEEKLIGFSEFVQGLALSVESLHMRFGSPTLAKSFYQSNTRLEKHLIDLFQNRLGLLIEELGEHSKALNHGNAQEALTEMVDVVYEALGILYTAGEMALEPMKAVIEKNNAKTPDTHRPDPQTGKLIRRET